jgi:hypothetical protein
MSENLESIVIDFNNTLHELMDQLFAATHDSEIEINKELIKKAISANKILLIQQYCIHILQFSDLIYKRDEKVIDSLNVNDINSKEGGDNETLDKILKLKNIWGYLTDDNKECVYDYLEVLTDKATDYFRIKYS